MDKKVHVMAIGAHAGDMELTCGGVLTKYAMEGHRVTIVHMTPGEKGYSKLNAKEYKEQKIEESNLFASKIGAESLILPYKDGELVADDNTKFSVCDIIRKYKPDIIITHWKNSIHKDHKAVYKIVQDAYFYAAIKSFERDLPAHGIKGLYYAENWEDAYDFKPYIYLDISGAYEKWLDALKCYEFIRLGKEFNYLDYYKALAIVRGAECRKKSAETFAVDALNIKQTLDYF
ncbi:PIG-L deacetylase family protein [Anaerovorax odorimutans]|uniref:PIG-L deacetylase family protein n=1 Tax=Anaerovorax odorimutans TaxID=109327 RepID=UPI000426574A|nr:PIG-L family deacetylase [Anaerovorax odorimutans]